MLFHSLGFPGEIRYVLRMKIMLHVNSAFLVRKRNRYRLLYRRRKKKRKGAGTHYLTTNEAETAPCLPFKSNKEI